MQKKHAKGFFINSSYRRTRALTALIRALGHGREEEGKVPQAQDFSPSPPAPGGKEGVLQPFKEPMKKAVGI
jgi:hypothetical protein